MNRVINNNSGFSLVEVLVAIALLGIFVLPVTGMFTASLRASESSRISAEAYSIANRVIESMDESEMCIPCQNEALSPDDYTLYDINSDYEVKKSITITDNAKMESFADLEKLSENGELLVVDASEDGTIKLTNAIVSQVYYEPAFAPDKAEVSIIFEDDKITYNNTTSANTLIAQRNLDNVKVIGGSSNLNLILNNLSSSDKNLYAVNAPSNSLFSYKTVVSSPAKWELYDNFDEGDKNETGNVAEADITISVRHISTDKEYSVNTKRVVYKYEI